MDPATNIAVAAGPAAIAKGIATAENLPGWVHQMNPFLIQFTEHIGIRWYGLAYLTGFFAGYFIMVLIARRGLIAADGTRSLPEEKLGDYLLAIVLGTMLGGRVGYALFYSQDLLTDVSAKFPFWGVLRVWEGGMTSHGGMLGIILAAVWYARRQKKLSRPNAPPQDWMNLGDLTTLGGSLGICAGRIANFINGELYGRPIESLKSFGAQFAVKFPTEAFLWLKYDAEKSITDKAPDLLPRLAGAAEAVGTSSSNWLATVSRVRTSMPARAEVQNVIQKIIAATEQHNRAVIDALQPVLTARHPYQLYGSLLEGLLLFFIAAAVWYKPRKPGVVGGIWLVSYAIVRILTESIRMPDAHLGYQLLGLTRGQWLSVAMLVGSIGVLIYALRRDKLPIGGWGPRPD
jgi:phosphatidylglycerol---prolipoprotein diacylglyceryl transferase